MSPLRFFAIIMVGAFFATFAETKTLHVQCKCGEFSHSSGVSRTTFLQIIESSAVFDVGSPELASDVRRFTDMMNVSCENTINAEMPVTYDCRVQQKPFAKASSEKSKSKKDAKRRSPSLGHENEENNTADIERETFIRFVENTRGCYRNKKCCSDCWTDEELKKSRDKGLGFN